MAEVEPWGDPDPGLHWFALTAGDYWIELGGRELARVDYFAVRLWEDLLQLLPSALQPVPADLAEFVAADRGRWNAWLEDEKSSERAWDAVLWHGEHSLDFGYLRRPPRVRAWRTVTGGRDEVTVTVDDSRGSLPAASFTDAVRRFDAELIAGMERRVEELERTGPPAGVELDLTQLRREHDDRATWLARRFAADPPETDWAAVRLGAAELLAHE